MTAPFSPFTDKTELPPVRPRDLYRPTTQEKRNACETLLRCDLPRETRSVIREIYEDEA